jgi:hypothetical protein
MDYRKEFNGKLEVEWISVDDAMPLDEHFKEFPHEGVCGIITEVFILINDEEDLNDDPSVVMIEFLVDHDGKSSWCWGGGALYPEFHADNIKFWADVPTYTKRSMLK